MDSMLHASSVYEFLTVKFFNVYVILKASAKGVLISKHSLRQLWLDEVHHIQNHYLYMLVRHN